MKKILIVGGSGGIGKELVKKLSGIYDGSIGYDTDFKYCAIGVGSKDLDVRDYLQCVSVMNEVEPDIVINCSGVNHDSMLHRIGQQGQYLINHALDVNIHGSLNLAIAALPGMRERGYGRLIYLSSILSTKQVNGTGVYSLCKAAIDRLVKSISAENISKGVTCNSIQLGYFDAGMTYKVPNKEEIESSLPLKRFGRISELTRVIETIIETEYLTGANIELNGGIS